MKFIHVGLVSSTAASAERFFGELLGLEKTRESRLGADLAEGLFGLQDGCDIVYYGSGGLVFEVFLTGPCEATDPKITHTCVEVDDRDGLLSRARDMGYEVREVAKGDKTVAFLADHDGNLFEVKGGS